MRAPRVSPALLRRLALMLGVGGAATAAGTDDAEAIFVPASPRLARAAEEALAKGATSRQIWSDIGALRSSLFHEHGNPTVQPWMREVADHEASFAPGWRENVPEHGGWGGLSLGDLLDHTRFYSAIKGAPDINVNLTRGGHVSQIETLDHFDRYKPDDLTMSFSDDMLDRWGPSVVGHEAQHAVSYLRGLNNGTARGSAAGPVEELRKLLRRLMRVERDNADKQFRMHGDWDAAHKSDRFTLLMDAANRVPDSVVRTIAGDLLYYGNKGEKAARLTQFRSPLNQSERRALYPEDTIDPYSLEHYIESKLPEMLLKGLGGGSLALSVGTSDAVRRELMRRNSRQRS